jgi:putative tryptophan/tyrosine transport system substrate-binding protein
MRRRDFITGVAGSAVAWPLTALAQHQGRVYRIAVLVNSDRQAPTVIAFFDELRLNGFIEGQNLSVAVDGFGIRDEQTDRLVAEVIKAAPDAVISPEQATRALQKLTKTIPIIAMTEDMLEAKLVPSLARPGGNTTGISLLSHELDSKRLGILMEAVPGVRRIAALADSTITPPRHLQALQAAARARGIELSVFSIAKPEESVPAISAAKAAGAQAINVLATPMTYVVRPAIFERVTELRLPAIYQWPEMAEEGGLAGYGPRFPQIWRQRARMVVKILRGVKPADIPVEQPTRFELVINLRTAKAIGHEVPASLVLFADKVIE